MDNSDLWVIWLGLFLRPATKNAIFFSLYVNIIAAEPPIYVTLHIIELQLGRGREKIDSLLKPWLQDYQIIPYSMLNIILTK